jgi:hypothetical protein
MMVRNPLGAEYLQLQRSVNIDISRNDAVGTINVHVAARTRLG